MDWMDGYEARDDACWTRIWDGMMTKRASRGREEMNFLEIAALSPTQVGLDFSFEGRGGGVERGAGRRGLVMVILRGTRSAPPSTSSLRCPRRARTRLSVPFLACRPGAHTDCLTDDSVCRRIFGPLLLPSVLPTVVRSALLTSAFVLPFSTAASLSPSLLGGAFLRSAGGLPIVLGRGRE